MSPGEQIRVFTDSNPFMGPAFKGVQLDKAEGSFLGRECFEDKFPSWFVREFAFMRGVAYPLKAFIKCQYLERRAEA